MLILILLLLLLLLLLSLLLLFIISLNVLDFFQIREFSGCHLVKLDCIKITYNLVNPLPDSM